MGVLTNDTELLVATIFRQFRDQLEDVAYNFEDYEHPRYFTNALVQTVRADFSYYGYKKDGNTPSGYEARHCSKYIHIMLCGNVHAWYCVSSQHNPASIEPKDWVNSSNHDSCWSSDGLDIFSKYYFNSCEYVQAHLPKSEHVAPKDVSKFIMYEGMKVLDISFTRDRSNMDRYRYNVLSTEMSEAQVGIVKS